MYQKQITKHNNKEVQMKYKLQLSARHPAEDGKMFTSKAILEIEQRPDLWRAEGTYMEHSSFCPFHAKIRVNTSKVTWTVRNEFTDRYFDIEVKQTEDTQNVIIDVRNGASIRVQLLELRES
jgi:hypothetical protein